MPESSHTRSSSTPFPTEGIGLNRSPACRAALAPVGILHHAERLPETVEGTPASFRETSAASRINYICLDILRQVQEDKRPIGSCFVHHHTSKTSCHMPEAFNMDTTLTHDGGFTLDWLNLLKAKKWPVPGWPTSMRCRSARWTEF